MATSKLSSGACRCGTSSGGGVAARVQQHQEQRRCVVVVAGARHARRAVLLPPLRAAGDLASSSTTTTTTTTSAGPSVYDILKPITSSGKVADLREGIAGFYDESSALWERVWGDHMHHGYYPQGAPPKSNRQAQVDMIEEVLSWAGVDEEGAGVRSVVDVGCGIGGSSRHLARKFGCSARGITLSPVQAARANELSAAEGLGERCSFQVADALRQPFADGSFDLVWSLESGEHMPDKARFVGELARVCAPGGRVIVVTWCHRVLGEGERGLTPDEAALLERINEAYYLPAWCSVADYERLFAAEGLQDIRTADWSREVSPFWGEVIKSAATSSGIAGLLRAGWTTIKGALVMPLMAQGYRTGLVKFVLITGVKK